jgi:glycerophosphoryl diester phosphodiesterase
MLKIGHRGACGYAPENTLAAFRKALDLKVDTIEFDVHVCKSGEVVIIHDDTVDRTADGKGRVAKKNLKELKGLNIEKKNKIPTLEEALNFVDRRSKINIELKGKGTAKPVYKIISHYINKKGWERDDFYISSFSKKEIIDFRNEDGKFNLGYIISKKPLSLYKFAEKNKLYSLNISLKLATKKFIEKTQKKGFKVFVWTVNDKENIEKIKNLGADGIFSNYPDKI